MNLLIYLFVFTFGALLGSFLNCLAYRLELESQKDYKGSPSHSFLRGRSFCPKCKHTLGFWDLLPILSFIFLRAKCRYCSKKISWQYPAAEIAMGLLLILNFKFLILHEFLNFKTFLTAAYLIFITGALLVIFIYDLKHYIIPDKVVFPAMAAALLYQMFFGDFKFALLAAIVAAGFFFAIWALSKGKWMGFGDVKLAFLMGLLLGWPNILVGLFFSFLIGAIIGLGLVAFGKKKLKSMVPFGPFLVLGAFIALFFSQQIIGFYVKLCF